MRSRIARIALTLVATAATGLIVPWGVSQDKKVPQRLVFEATLGDVTFDHANHVAAAKGDCAACHDKLWPQDAKAPLKYRDKMHRTAEAAKASCAACHHAEGVAFASKGNCKTCHVKN